MQELIRASKASNVTFVGFQYKKIRTFPFRSTIMKRKRNVLFYFFKHRYSAVIRSADGTKLAIYQVLEFNSLNWATVDTWEFKPPSTLMIWPVTYWLSSEAK